MKTIFLRKATYLVLLLCGFFYSSCTNDWLPIQTEELENIELLAAAEGAVEIKAPAGSYIAGVGTYRFQAISPTGWKMTGLTWSVDEAVGRIEGSNTNEFVEISFHNNGYADIMITCQLTSGTTTRNHAQILTVKAISRYPVISIEKEVEVIPAIKHTVSARYSSVGTVRYEWSIPNSISYTYPPIINRSQVELIYPNVGEYRIGVRAVDGDQYSDWVYETVKVIPGPSLTYFNISFENMVETCSFELILSHNDYPESPQTYFRFEDRVQLDRFYTMEDDAMLLPGNYTLQLCHYGGWGGDYYTYQIPIIEGGVLNAVMSHSNNWTKVEYCESSCIYLEREK